MPDETVTPPIETPPVTPDPAVPVVTPPVEAAVVAPPAEIVYTLKVPDGSALDATASERFAVFAKTHRLSQDAAQQALELAHGEVTASTDRVISAHKARVEQWRTDALADPALGRTEVERASAIKLGMGVIDRFERVDPEGAKALKRELDATGYGNAPGAVRFFAFLGRSMAEGRLAVTEPRGASEKKTVAERLYPSLPAGAT